MPERRRRRRSEDMPTVPTVDKAPAGSGLAPVEERYAEPAKTRRTQSRAQAIEASPGEVTMEEQIHSDDPQPAPKPRRNSRSKEDSASSLERARKRAAEILEHDIGVEEDDKYYIPPEIVPEGFTYLWRRKSVYGKEDPQYMVKLRQTGWEVVPSDRHPELMPSTGGPYYAIEREGMVLMEIPTEVYKLLAAKEHRKALEQVRVKNQQLNNAPTVKGVQTFPRDANPNVKPSVRRGYEPLILPDN